MTPNKFHDTVVLGMAWTPANLPTTSQRGAECTVSHALFCQLGGFPIHRYNETRDLLPDVMTEACNSVAVEPVLTPVNGETFQHPSTTTDSKARLDIVAGRVWGGRFDRAFFDVCVFNAYPVERGLQQSNFI